MYKDRVDIEGPPRGRPWPTWAEVLVWAAAHLIGAIVGRGCGVSP